MAIKKRKSVFLTRAQMSTSRIEKMKAKERTVPEQREEVVVSTFIIQYDGGHWKSMNHQFLGQGAQMPLVRVKAISNKGHWKDHCKVERLLSLVCPLS